MSARLAAVLAVGLGSSVYAGPALTFYVLEGDNPGGTLARGSLADGVATEIGPTSYDGGAGLEFTTDGRLFAIGPTPFPARISQIDPNTGAPTTLVANIVFDVPTVYYSTALAFDDAGILYGYGRGLPRADSLFRYDSYTGAFLGSVDVDLSGSTAGFDGTNALAVRDDGSLIAFEYDGNLLISIDAATGATTLISNFNGSLGFVRGMSTYQGVTYINAGDLGQEVYELNPYTGAVTHVATLSGLDHPAFGFAVIPAPGTGALLAGLGLLAARRRR